MKEGYSVAGTAHGSTTRKQTVDPATGATVLELAAGEAAAVATEARAVVKALTQSRDGTSTMIIDHFPPRNYVPL